MRISVAGRSHPRAKPASLSALLLAALVLCAAAGCARRAAAPASTLHWAAAHAAPAFDPDGAADPLRAALEGALTRRLLERDAKGHVRFAAAESAWTSADGRTLTLRLRRNLRFTDGSNASSDDFRDALLAGLAREDHATRAWLLGAVAGVERVRAGRPLPAIGIEASDPRTLVLHLVRPDPRILERLASPGVGEAWKRRSGSWRDAVGLGPYRVRSEDPGRALTLVRATGEDAERARADTVLVRFVTGTPRVRTLLRHGSADFVWPLPPSLAEEPLPAGYVQRTLEALPPRRLLLVLRADVPPTTKLPARHALAHALNRGALLEALGVRSGGAEEWLAGAGAFEFPSLDASEVRSWLARGKLGVSFHVTLAYDADGAGADLARALQGQWAALGLYAELRALRGGDAEAEPLRAAAAQAQLVETQAPLPGAAAELATLVMPLRGPAIGNVRTGWRTREFDRSIAPGATEALDAGAAQSRLADELVALPLAKLPWTWIERSGPAASISFDPATGPVLAR
jgi:ABC-type transport system substrate-binding protein